MNVDGQSFFYCKSNEYEGYFSKKSCKPVNTKSEIPEWLKQTEGSCRYYTKKKSDLEKHLYGMHRMKYLDHCFRCTHCDHVAVDRIRAKTHMNSCESLLNWAAESDVLYPINLVFLSKYKFWTSDKLVESCRSKSDIIKNDKDMIREEILKGFSEKYIVTIAPENVPTNVAKTVSKTAPTQNVSHSASTVCDIAPDTSNVGVDQIDNEIDVNDYEYYELQMNLEMMNRA